MKKLITILLAISLMLSLTACGKEEPEAVVTEEPPVTSSEPETINEHEPVETDIPENPASDFEYNRIWGGIEITRYKGTSTKVRIPAEIDGKPVTSIGYNVFSEGAEGSIKITEIHFPDTLLFIGESAFWWCDELTEIVLPDSVRRIGYGAFGNCNNLTSITLSKDLTYIGNSAFYPCDSLEKITLPDNLLVIADFAFADCKSLTSITIPDSVVFLGNSVFRHCEGLEVTYKNQTYPMVQIDGLYELSPDIFDNIFGTEEESLIPLELLNYKTDDNINSIDNTHFFGGSGGFHFVIDDWTLITDNSIIKKYFYGIWSNFTWWDNGRFINDNGFLIIDDSEKSNLQRSFTFNGYYQVSETVLVAHNTGNAGEQYFFWLDTNNPDVMYCMSGAYYSMDKDSFESENLTYRISAEAVSKLTKTDLPLNTPQDGFMSRIALEDMADKYEIDRELLNTVELYNGYLQTIDRLYPVYLISEEPDKIVLKIELFTMAGEVPVVISTIEKIDGVWVRTSESNNG